MEESVFAPVAGILRQYHEAGFFPDAAYAVFNSSGTILYRGTCGQAQNGSWFDLASLTKLFTSTAVLALVQKGALRLDDTAAGLLREALCGGAYTVLRQRLEHVTLQMLLTHTSGLIPWFPFYAQPKPFWAALEDVLAANEPLPGMHYSDLNFMLLGKILEEQTHQGLEQVFAEMGEALLPGADMAFLPPKSLLAKRLVQAGRVSVCGYGNPIEEAMCAERGLAFSGFRPKGAAVTGQANDGNCWYYFNGVSGHAGLFAPVDTLVRLGRLYLASKDAVFLRAMQDWGMGRGLGFEVDEKFPEGCGHTGFTGTSLWISPAHGVGMAILTNRLARRDAAAQDLNGFRKAVHTQVLEIIKTV
ncbi:beta-lactamase family protein [Ruminococcaceae bacterium OttesenSCG-928-D13]|nr:beta-lactamase family protein [Ruminococcaceae bacterium OttesenSCG-928-D13]